MELPKWAKINEPLLKDIDSTLYLLDAGQEGADIKKNIVYANTAIDDRVQVHIDSNPWLRVFNLPADGKYTRLINMLGDKEVFIALVSLMVQFTNAASEDKKWLDSNPYRVKQKMIELLPRLKSMIRYRYPHGEMDNLISTAKYYNKKLVKLLK